MAQVALAQTTTIDFNDLPSNSYLTKSYNKDGFNFSINAGGAGQIVTRSGEGYEASISLYDNNFEIGALTQWTIKKIDGTEFQFHSIYLKEPNIGASTSGEIQGFKNGNPVGSSKTVDFNGLKSFVSDSDFYDIDEIRISAADINFHLDHFTFGPVYSPVDTAPAVISSLSILGSPGPFATSISYSVNFNKSVTGVSTDDFQLTTTSTVTGDIDSVSGSGSSYTVTVNNISGIGTIRLDLKGGTNIANTNGNIGTPAYTSGPVHTLSDCGVEAFESGTILDGASSFTSHGKTFTLSTGFEIENKTGFGAVSPGGSALSNKFIKNNNTAGKFSISSAQDFTMSSVDLYLSSAPAGNIPTSNGSLVIRGKRDGHIQYTITKTNGFPTSTSVNGGFFTINFATAGVGNYRNVNIDELEFTIADGFVELLVDNFNHCQVAPDVDILAPKIITINPDPAALSNASSVSFEVIFDEAASAVSIDDFTLTTTGTASGTIAAVFGSGSVYTVSVTGISGEGSIRVDLISGNDIRDALNNSPSPGFAGQEHLVGACFIETFEDETDGAKSFTGNGKIFNLVGNWEIDRATPSTGIHSSKVNTVNTGAGPYSITSTDGLFIAKKLALFVSSLASGSVPTNDGTVKLAGYEGSTLKYEWTQTGGFPTEFTSNNGYFIADLIGGFNPGIEQLKIDRLEITLGGSFVYFNLENFEWCADNTAPSGYTVAIDQDAIDNSNRTNVSFTFEGAELGTTYNYTFTSAGGGTAVTGLGTITSANQQITGIDLSSLGDGTITLSVVLKDTYENIGLPAEDTVIKSLNSAPVVQVPSAPTVYEDDVQVPIAGFSVSDPDGDNVMLTFTVTGGTVSIGLNAVWFGGDGNGSSNFSASSSPAAINAALEELTFTPTPDLYGTNAGEISIVAFDGILNSSVTAVTFDIIGVNDDPTITGLPATVTVEEDSTEEFFDISSASIGDIDAGSGNLSLILVANGGVFDVAAGTGMTIHGHLTDSLTLTGNLINLNNYIDQPSNIYFRPDQDLSGNGAASIEVYLNDNGNTGTGGGQTLYQGVISVNVTAVNDAPTVANPIPDQETSAGVAWSFQFAENTFTDVDNDNLTYSAQLSSGNALPTWLTFAPSIRTFSGTPTAANIGDYLITVIAKDGNGEEVEDSFTLSVALNRPKPISVQSINPDGSYKIGDVLTLQIKFDQIVTVDGTPALSLETGAVGAVAIYSAGSGSSSLSFEYTVEEGHSSPDLDYVSSGSLTLNGGSIRNSNAIDAGLSLPSPGNSGSLGANAAIVIDGIRPNVISKNVTIQLGASGNTSIAASDIDNGSSDANGIASMTLSQDTFDCSHVGANTVTLTVTDSNGNTDSATAIVTVEDVTVPAVVTRNIAIQLDATGNASITAADIDNGSTDSCGIASITLDKSSFDCGNVGANTVTLTVTDSNGNSNSATAIVTVEDVTAPVVVTRNITIQLDATGNASITASDIENSSSDTCGIASMTLDKSSFDCGDVGANTVTLTVTDSNGNTDSATAIVRVEDVTAPVVVTRNIAIQLDATGNASITAADIDNGSTDSCGIASMTLDKSSFDCGDVGANTVILTVTDVNGNTDSAMAIVTVENTLPPTVQTRNITVQLDATGNASITAADAENGSSNSCAIAEMTLSKTGFTCSDIGHNVVTLTMTDVNGNIGSATAVVTVEDIIPATVLTQNITVQLDATGNASITAADIDNGSSDACGIADMTLSKTDFDCSDIGLNVVTLTVTDVNGNTATGTAVVTVEDVTAPSVLTQNITVQLNATGNVGITAADIDNGSSDACGIVDLSLSKTDFDCSNIGLNVVTLTVTDVNGNTDSATAVVTVEDVTAPSVLTQNITIQLDATGNASITAADIDNGSSDSCGIASMTLSQENFDCSHVGDNTVTLTVTDLTGNTDSSTAIVTVEDLTAPAVVNRNITIQLDASGNASITAADTDNGSSDVCGNASMSLDKSDFTCSDIGLNVVTLTVTDVNGNTATGTAVVTVEDVTAPSVLTQNITVQLDATGNASITAADIDNGSTDACGIASMTLSQENFDCSHVGDNTVTLTVTDLNGNTATGVAIVTVEDVTAPIVVTKNLTLTLQAVGAITIDAEDVDDGSYDSCGSFSLSLDKSQFDANDIGENIVTLTVTDESGNQSIGTAVVTILPREITGLSLPDRSFVYDGTIKSLTLTGDFPEGTTVTYTDNLRSDAGSQTVTAKVNGTNYTDLIFTANLTITPAVLHVTANSGQGKPFGKADPELTYTATGFVNGENLGIMQGSLDREEGESIGFYTISLGSVAAGSNYTITYSGAAFEIFSHDSDGDEVPDDVEIHDGTDPKDPYDYKDSDGDDVPDLVEVENGTNPLDPSDYVDSDGDQVPDYVEKREGTDPNNSKDYLDQDKDGVADYVQVRAITEFVASTTEVEWGTPLTEVNVPEQVLVITNQSEVLNLPIDWDLSFYNPRKAGSTVYTGVPELPAGRFNPYSLNPELSITVMDKPAPQDILLSNNQFVGIPDQFFQLIGSFTVVDPADNMHTFILPEGEGDNLHFEINEGHLFWSSADRQSGRDNFTLIVLVQDRAGNELRKSFSIQRLRTPLEQLEVFNSFTPNGDGVNDTWGVPALRYYNKVRIQVFDNAGNRVFYTENPDLGWDGTHHGKPLPVSSYVYVIEVGETGEIKRGMLNLLRQ